METQVVLVLFMCASILAAAVENITITNDILMSILDSNTDKYKMVCVPKIECINNTVARAGEPFLDDLDRSNTACKDGEVLCRLEEDDITATTSSPLTNPVTTAPSYVAEATTPGIRFGQTSESPATGPKVNTKTQNCRTLQQNGITFRSDKEFNSDDMEQEADLGEFPWTVAVYRRKNPVEYVGVGSLINSKAVLSAAHLFSKKRKRVNLYIRAGVHNRTEDSMLNHQESDVQSVIVHENYSSGEMSNDVALLILSKTIIPAVNIGFVCLPPATMDVMYPTQCIVSGWGSDKLGGPLRETKKAIEVPLVENSACEDALKSSQVIKDSYHLPDSMMCAGGDGEDTCKGDGGGPLVCPYSASAGVYYQVGIASWGIGCGEPGRPAVYASVVNARDWIDSHMRQNSLDTDSYALE